MARAAWSWGDVPGPDGQHTPHGPRGRKHPVTLGHHDATIVQWAQRDERIVYIAGEIGCGEGVVARRLKVLGVECRR